MLLDKKIPHKYNARYLFMLLINDVLFLTNHIRTDSSTQSNIRVLEYRPASGKLKPYQGKHATYI